MKQTRNPDADETASENVVVAVERLVVCRKHYNRKDLAIEAHRCCLDRP